MITIVDVFHLNSCGSWQVWPKRIHSNVSSQTLLALSVSSLNPIPRWTTSLQNQKSPTAYWILLLLVSVVKFPAQNLSIRCYYRHFFLCLCLCLSPYHFLFKKKRNKEGLRWYLLGWLVMRKLEENHYLVMLMGLWIGGWSWDLGGVFHGVDILFYFPKKKRYFILQNTVFLLRLLLGSKIRESDKWTTLE